MRIPLGIVFGLLFAISVVTWVLRAFTPAQSPAPPAPAAPNEVLLAGERLKLEPPAGYCLLDSKRDSDGRFLKAMQERSPANFVVIRGFIECDNLYAIRSGSPGRIDSFGAISVKQEQEHVVTAGGRTRTEYLNAVEASSPRVDVDQVKRDIASRLADIHGSANLASVGVLQRDDAAVYVGAVAQFQVGGIETRPYLYVGAVTVVGSVPLIIALSHVVDAGLDVRDVLSVQARYLHSLLEANAELNASAAGQAIGIPTYRAPIYVGDVVLLLSGVGLIAVFA